MNTLVDVNTGDAVSSIAAVPGAARLFPGRLSRARQLIGLEGTSRSTYAAPSASGRRAGSLIDEVEASRPPGAEAHRF